MGFLTGKYKKGFTPPLDARINQTRYTWLKEKFENVEEDVYQIVEELEKLAKDYGKPLSQLAISWTIAHPAVTSTIIGPRSMLQLEDCFAALEWKLDSDILKRVDELVPPGMDLLAW